MLRYTYLRRTHIYIYIYIHLLVWIRVSSTDPSRTRNLIDAFVYNNILCYEFIAFLYIYIYIYTDGDRYNRIYNDSNNDEDDDSVRDTSGDWVYPSLYIAVRLIDRHRRFRSGCPNVAATRYKKKIYIKHNICNIAVSSSVASRLEKTSFKNTKTK